MAFDVDPTGQLGRPAPLDVITHSVRLLDSRLTELAIGPDGSGPDFLGMLGELGIAATFTHNPDLPSDTPSSPNTSHWPGYLVRRGQTIRSRADMYLNNPSPAATRWAGRVLHREAYGNVGIRIHVDVS